MVYAAYCKAGNLIELRSEIPHICHVFDGLVINAFSRILKRVIEGWGHKDVKRAISVAY